MSSSSQYQMPSAIISIKRDENSREKCEEHNNNRFQQHSRNAQQQFDIGSIARSNKSKVAIAFENIAAAAADGGEIEMMMVKSGGVSSVSTRSSSDADGKNCSREPRARHILKIQILPATRSRRSDASEKFIAAVAVDKKICEREKEEKHASVREMSVVSSRKDAIYGNVTIIQQQQRDSEECEFDGNLSDDQKLVLNVTSACHKSRENGGGVRVSVSGQCSPECEDHLDSGTCSDVEVKASAESPPPLPPKGFKKKLTKLSESTCSDASSASSTADSMQYHLLSPDLIRSINGGNKSQATSNKNNKSVTLIKADEAEDSEAIIGLLPRSLLHDIRTHTMKSFLRSELLHTDDDHYDVDGEEEDSQNESSAEEEEEEELVFSERHDSDCESARVLSFYDDDKFYKFHINENFSPSSSGEGEKDSKGSHEESDESFAGYRDLRSATSTIRSAKGTIRGVKNRVRNGIATFLQMQQTTVKSFKEKDGGRIVLYTTSMGIVRSTYAKCQAMKQILRTLMVKFEERDIFMSVNHQQEIRDRMQNDDIEVPQLFVDGQYIGNADQVERLNETGELRAMLKPYKCRDSLVTCNMCGGYKMLPCPSCGGSKKSIHRNHFTAEFIALKCMNCDEVGLVKCFNCL